MKISSGKPAELCDIIMRTTNALRCSFVKGLSFSWGLSHDLTIFIHTLHDSVVTSVGCEWGRSWNSAVVPMVPLLADLVELIYLKINY